MAPLTFADTHNMVAYLSKSDASTSFDQIVDFLNSHTIHYTLVVNPTIYVSCIKQFWATTSIKKAIDVVKLQALIDGKKVVITKDVIRQDVHSDDADGVECLPNEEIFTELARMGYEKPPPKLTFYKAFFSAQWKFLIHTLVQCISDKRTVWNEFSCSMASSVICLATETYATLSQKEAELEQDKTNQGLEIIMLKKRVKKLEKKRRSKSSRLKRLKKGRIDDDNAVTKEVNAAEPTVFNDEEVTMTMAQTLIKMKAEKARLLDEQIAKRLHDEENMAGYKMEHFKGMTYDKVRSIFERENKKIKTLFKHDKVVEEPQKKRVAEETLLQESFKKLKAVEVSSSESTQDNPTNDPKEMSEDDVQNMLEIIPVTEFKVEALQVKEILSLFKCCDDHDAKCILQVEEDSEMARDLLMKIFMEANKPKSRSLDTSSK
nr:hypothetical protein [Tanacetum cinerariifolium]